MKIKPKATFVIPTYKGAGYLSETIESVRNQTVKQWELIVVDDGSPDMTRELMEYYTSLDSRIQYIRLLENKGAVNARNTGNRAANSSLILVLDHDDLAAANRLQVTLDHFEKHPDTGIFHAGWTECNIHGHPHTRWKPMRSVSMKDFRSGKMLFCHSTVAYRTETAFETPYRDVKGRTDDHVALEDWLKAGLKFRSSDRSLCDVRRLPMGQMQRIRTAKGLPPSWSQ